MPGTTLLIRCGQESEWFLCCLQVFLKAPDVILLNHDMILFRQKQGIVLLKAPKALFRLRSGNFCNTYISFLNAYSAFFVIRLHSKQRQRSINTAVNQFGCCLLADCPKQFGLYDFKEQNCFLVISIVINACFVYVFNFLVKETLGNSYLSLMRS